MSKKLLAVCMAALLALSVVCGCQRSGQKVYRAQEKVITAAETTAAVPTTAAAPTTAEPTTAPPTTEEPTTAEPTTAAPTTAEPTTEPPTERRAESVVRVTEPPAPQDTVGDYVINTNTKKFHYPNCGSVDKIAEKNRWDYSGSRDEIIAMGYAPCKRCNP